MKKQYIKLNDNDMHLSFGNLCRLIKVSSKSKDSGIQTEIFCILFDVDNVNDTTINNYCVGCRSINEIYKQKYLNYQKKYEKDKSILLPIISSLVSILDGTIYNDLTINTINENVNLKYLCNKLYNLSKNDKDCSNDFSGKLNTLIKNNNYYEVISKILFFVVLEKKQPIYEIEVKKQVIENILNNTNISANDLEEYLNLKLNEGVNYNYLLKKLSDEGNAYACYEMGISEYKGYYVGHSRYDKAFFYFKKASESNHAISYYLMGRMAYDKKVNYNLDEAFKCIELAHNLGCVAATNFLGKLYLDGIYPIKKNIKEAIKYFEIATTKNYTYAFNNLGKIYENKDIEKAFDYYLKSANLGDSWALNKIGEKYRLENNYKEAFNYYNKAIDVPLEIVQPYAFYNLAKYYYLNGNIDASVLKDYDLAINYLKLASDKGVIDATIELLSIYAKEYLLNRNKIDKLKIDDLIIKLENNPLYDSKLKKEVENKLKHIQKENLINLDILKEKNFTYLV